MMYIFNKVILALCLMALPLNVLSSADLGVNFGSKAAGKLATHCIQYALRQPRQLQLNLQSRINPWFEKIARINSRTKLVLNDFTISFENDIVELALYNTILKSTSDINILPLPFFLGEDTAYLHAEIPRAVLKLDVRNFDVKLHECVVETTSLDVKLDRAFLLNVLLSPLHSLLPRSLVQESLCSSIADSLSVFENRFALEIGLVQLIPDKFQEYLAWPNSTMFAQLSTAEARDDHLSMKVAVEWINNAGMLGTTEESITVLDPTPQTTVSFAAPAFPTVAMNSDISFSPPDAVNTNNLQFFPTTEVAPPHEKIILRDTPFLPNGANLEVSGERVAFWIEDQLLNDLFQQFRWDFEWMDEEIPVDSQNLPSATREFLSTLCTDCFFSLKVSTNGAPHVSVVNESIVLEKSDRIFMKVVNPVRNVTSIFVSFFLTLNIQLAPKVESGIFKTQVDLLDTNIKMERGAFPSSWNFFVQDLVKGMIINVIWPGLKKEIENLSYSDGVEIPSTCGTEPYTAQLHFSENSFGASTALQLDDISLGACLQQLKSKLPDPSTLFIIKEAR